MNAVSRWKIIATLIAIFAAGAITGSLITVGVIKHEVRRQSDPRLWFQLTMNRWKVRLHLTPDQEQRLRPIVQQTVDELRNLRSLDLRETDGILTRAQDRIDPILNADQRARLRRMREERKRRLQEWFNLPEPQK